MEVWVKEVGKYGAIKEIGNSLEAMQNVVGGYVECVALPNKIDLWVHEEGLLVEKPRVNLIVEKDGIPINQIYGNVFFAGRDQDGETISLTKQQREWIANHLSEYGLVVSEIPYLAYRVEVMG